MYSLDIHNFAASKTMPFPDLTVGEDLSTDQVEQAGRWMRRQFIETDQVRHVYRTLDATLARNDRTRTGDGLPLAKQLVVLTGDNGSGKSRCILEWVRQFYLSVFAGVSLVIDRPVRFELEPGVLADWTPVMWVNVGVSDGAGAIDRRAAEFFGLPDSGTTDKVGRRARNALRRHRVNAMVLDDAHMVSSSASKYRSVSDHLKSTNSELGITDTTMVLVGANLETHPLLDDPQISARARFTQLSPYAIDTDEQRAKFQGLLQGLEHTLGEHIPLITPELLSSQLIAFIHHRTQGYLGDVMDLITDATLIALAQGASTLTAAHLAEVPTTLRAQRRQREVELTYTRTQTAEATTKRRAAKKPTATRRANKASTLKANNTKAVAG